MATKREVERLIKIARSGHKGNLTKRERHFFENTQKTGNLFIVRNDDGRYQKLVNSIAEKTGQPYQMLNVITNKETEL